MSPHKGICLSEHHTNLTPNHCCNRCLIVYTGYDTGCSAPLARLRSQMRRVDPCSLCRTTGRPAARTWEVTSPQAPMFLCHTAHGSPRKASAPLDVEHHSGGPVDDGAEL
jgi:hypothetical protein